jgi:hypothetical protein
MEERDSGIVALNALVRKGRVVKNLSKFAGMTAYRLGAKRCLVARCVGYASSSAGVGSRLSSGDANLSGIKR